MVLPEGSVVKGIHTAYEVNRGLDRKFTYLDTHGRPVVVLQRNNVGVEHNVAFIVNYTFSAVSLVRFSITESPALCCPSDNRETDMELFIRYIPQHAVSKMRNFYFHGGNF